MKIAIIGTGYVGLVTGAMFADRGNKVVCVDSNSKIIDSLNSGKLHIFEPGLQDIVIKAVQRGDLHFTSDFRMVLDSEIIFIAVGTPSDKDGSFNLKYVKNVAKSIGQLFREAQGFKVVVVKSTVPQGTSEIVSRIVNEEMGKNQNLEWAYVSNPETLAEGTAVSDFSKPERIIVGTFSDRAFSLMRELYHPFNIRSDRIMRGTPADAELAKLFSNTALACKVAMINEFAHIADLTPGADMDLIRKMICEDSRIGYSFMFPSPGYGGSCFPKDVQGLVAQANLHQYSPVLLRQIHESNELQKSYISEKIQTLLKEKKQPAIGIWGVTFKPNTDDMRDAASIPIIAKLLNLGAKIKVYDPKDSKAREVLGEKVTFVSDKFEAAKGADALILLTEWKEFDAPDFERLSQEMLGRQLFDLRNRWLPAAANRYGFEYYGVGRNYPASK